MSNPSTLTRQMTMELEPGPKDKVCVQGRALAGSSRNVGCLFADPQSLVVGRQPPASRQGFWLGLAARTLRACLLAGDLSFPLAASIGNSGGVESLRGALRFPYSCPARPARSPCSPTTEPTKQREKELDDFSILSIRSAWLPLVLAVIVCGLQLTFWENATAFFRRDGQPAHLRLCHSLPPRVPH